MSMSLQSTHAATASTYQSHWQYLAGSLAVVSLAMGAFAVTAQAADYPDEPVEFIVPWSPGGGSDTLMRIVSNHIEPHLGQPMPVVNMPGVSGTVGLAELAQRDPDGYTVGQVHDGFMVSHHTGLTQHNWDDYEPIAAITASPQYVTVNADRGWETFEEFVEYARENPDEVRFGVTLGGVPHLHGAMIEEAEDLSFRYVGFEGTGERIRALVGGHIDAAMGDIASSRQFVENGDLRFLAVGHDERMQQTPDVPTFQEMGYETLNLSILRDLIAPEGTPPERVEVLEQAVEAMAAEDDFVTSVNNAGAEVQFMAHEEYRAHLEELDATIERLAENLQQ